MMAINDFEFHFQNTMTSQFCQGNIPGNIPGFLLKGKKRANILRAGPGQVKAGKGLRIRGQENITKEAIIEQT
jgi:hypothetical protein